jgi:hypothetical protein
MHPDPEGWYVLVTAVRGQRGQIVRVSGSTGGTQANGPSGPPSIDASGRFVVFSSLASNLVAGDTNGVADVFLRDRDTDNDFNPDEAGAVRTTRVSVVPSYFLPGGRELDGASTSPAISADGRYVVFVSTATSLVPGGPAGLPQVFRVDRTTGGAASAQAFVLIANTAGTAGEATLTLLPDVGFTGTAPAPIVVPLPANSRTTVPITAERARSASAWRAPAAHRYRWW